MWCQLCVVPLFQRRVPGLYECLLLPYLLYKYVVYVHCRKIRKTDKQKEKKLKSLIIIALPREDQAHKLAYILLDFFPAVVVDIHILLKELILC